MAVSQRRRNLAIGAFIFLLIILPLIIFFVQQQQESRSRALKATTLFFQPTSTSSQPINANNGDPVSLDVMIDPGSTNVVSFVKLEVNYDPSKLQFNTVDPFLPNTDALPVVLEGPVYQSGTMSVVLTVGNDVTKAIQSVTKVGTLNFVAKGTATPSTVVSFGPASQVLSIGQNDNPNENVLSATTPAHIHIASVSGSPTPTPITCGTSPVFVANLTGSQEVPPTNSTATATVTLSTSVQYVQGSFAANNLNLSNVIAIHIHNPALSGQNAPPTVTLFDKNTDGILTSGFTFGEFLSGDTRDDMVDGNAYVNIHTTQFVDGEIRGQLICVPITPTVSSSPTPTTFPPTLTPTHTPIPGQSSVNLTLLMHGIGNSGDNPNPTVHTLSNKNPNTTTRPVVVYVYDLSNVLLSTHSGTVAYRQANGDFTGSVNLGSLTSGNYNIRVKSEKYLRRLVPGTHSFAGNAVNLPTTTLVTGDINNDNQLNILDYNILLGCYSDFAPATDCDAQRKFASDITDDGNVNQPDYNLFIRELSVQGGD